MNVNILAFTHVSHYTHTGASVKFSINWHETDNSACVLMLP